LQQLMQQLRNLLQSQVQLYLQTQIQVQEQEPANTYQCQIPVITHHQYVFTGIWHW
jgi:hypothetical protein